MIELDTRNTAGVEHRPFQPVIGRVSTISNDFFSFQFRTPQLLITAFIRIDEPFSEGPGKSFPFIPYKY